MSVNEESRSERPALFLANQGAQVLATLIILSAVNCFLPPDDGSGEYQDFKSQYVVDEHRHSLPFSGGLGLAVGRFGFGHESRFQTCRDEQPGCSAITTVKRGNNSAAAEGGCR